MKLTYIVLSLALVSASAFAAPKLSKRQLAFNDSVKTWLEAVPAWKKYEAKTRALEPEIGMPHQLFAEIAFMWDCESNITESENTYRTQFVCVNAKSKKGDMQGRYFYTGGPIKKFSSGSKMFNGTLQTIQSN